MFRKNKYRAQRHNGFPSKLEASVYNILLLRERAGEIAEIKRQQTVVLQDGSSKERICWKVDFSAVDKETENIFYIEAKGVETEAYRIKLKLYRKNIPTRLEIWKGSYKGPVLAEVINP